MRKKSNLLIIVGLLSLVTWACQDNLALQPINFGSEVAMSSPIIALGDSWQGNFQGLLDISVSYDTITDTVHGTITNVSARKLCWALSEPHMKLGTVTVGELGPQQLGHLLPGDQVITSLSVFTDPKYTGYNFDGYVLHMEVYDCGGGIPLPYPGGS